MVEFGKGLLKYCDRVIFYCQKFKMYCTTHKYLILISLVIEMKSFFNNRVGENEKMVYNKELINNFFDDLKKTKNILVQSIKYQHNSINGTLLKNNKKKFFKIISRDETLSERNSIKICNTLFPVMVQTDVYLYNDNLCLVLYDYDIKVGLNKGLLNDYFVDNDFNQSFDETPIYKILNFYKTSSKTCRKIYEAPIDVFFRDRVSSRLNNWYKNNTDFYKEVIFNGRKSVTTEKIIKDTILYFQSNKEHDGFITQGDHNVMNISTTPCFFDVGSAGYNYAIGEFAMCLISILFFDQYICPKYHKESYKNHEKVFELLDNYKPKIYYNISNRNIVIDCEFRVSKVRRTYVLKFLDIIKDFDIYNDLIYFIIMRLLCIFNINTFDKDDYYYILFLIHWFYSKLSDLDYNKLRGIILKMNLLN